jgi:hypothetical protein
MAAKLVAEADTAEGAGAPTAEVPREVEAASGDESVPQPAARNKAAEAMLVFIRLPFFKTHSPRHASLFPLVHFMGLIVASLNLGLGNKHG